MLLTKHPKEKHKCDANIKKKKKKFNQKDKVSSQQCYDVFFSSSPFFPNSVSICFHISSEVKWNFKKNK